MPSGSLPGASRCAPVFTQETRARQQNCTLNAWVHLLVPVYRSRRLLTQKSCRPDLQSHAQRATTGEPPIILKSSRRRPLSAVQVFRNLVQQVRPATSPQLHVHASSRERDPQPSAPAGRNHGLMERNSTFYVSSCTNSGNLHAAV